MKRFSSLLCLVLALVMLLALCACGADNGPAPSTPSTPDTPDAPDTPDTPTGESYTIRWSGFSAEGSVQNRVLEVPLKEYLEKESGGRIKMEIYTSGSLTAQGVTMDAIVSGVTDAGYDVPDGYAGVYPYNGLFGAPGLYYGDFKATYDTLQEYGTVYCDSYMADNFIVLSRQPASNLGMLSATPFETYDDMAGKVFRVTGDKIDYFNAVGASPVAMSATDVYESLRLNVIQGALLATVAIKTFSLADITGYWTATPFCTGGTGFFFSKALYDEMDPELQSVFDGACELMHDLAYTDIVEQLDDAEQAIAEVNPDFKYLEFDKDSIVKFCEVGEPLLEAKAEELNSQGLDGTGALEWLRAHTAEL